MTDARVPDEAIPSAPSTSSAAAEAHPDASPVLSLEDRAYVCLSARGSLRIGQLIHRSLRAYFSHFEHNLFNISDEEFVRLLESLVFGETGGTGTTSGLHRPEGDEHLAHDGSPSARGNVRQ